MHIHESVKYIIFLIVGVAIGYGVPYVFNDNKIFSSYEVDKASDNLSLSWKDTIEVSDQLAGEKVLIKAVSLSEPSWVAIQETSSGKILGAQFFEAGESVGEVDLLRGTTIGGTYLAVLRKDDGDKTFDLKKDVEILDSNGKTISVLFKVN